MAILHYGTDSFKLSRALFLKNILGDNISYQPLSFKSPDIYLGWGAKKYALRAKKAAEQNHKPFHFLEDGFLRSLYPSHISQNPLSVIYDRKGAYYDYKICSDLEDLIKNTDLTEGQEKEAFAAIDYIKSNKLSKYVIGSDPIEEHVTEDFDENAVLILDQTFGDASLEYGGIKKRDLVNIENDILRHYGDRKIFLKTHPDVIAGKKKGCFEKLYHHQNVKIINNISLTTLLEKKPKVIALTSLSGFEALLYDCDVTLYGLPWYAGYGLTEDKHKDAEALSLRRKAMPLSHLFYVAYMKYPIYLDPNTQKKSNFWRIAHYLARTARHIRDMSGTLYVFGLSYGSVLHKERGTPWKKKDLYPFLKTRHNKIIYVSDAQDALKKGLLQDKNAKIIVWGYRYSDDISLLLKHKNIPIIRIEDGFIRSFGLGKDFIPPLSLVFDKGNLYYNASNDNPSDIHTALDAKPMPYLDSMVQDIMKDIITHNITKYNIDDVSPIIIETEKPILCVVGQVPNDASLKYGSLPKNIQNNTDLLKYARQYFPDHYILFKPHPDIMAGHVKGEDLQQIKEYADVVDRSSSLISLINRADHILVMTSLAGLEAIIREKKVTVLGKPFYKGYGFCEGEEVSQLRKEEVSQLRKEDFIRSIYLDYPLYINTQNKFYISCQDAIYFILKQKMAIINPLRHIHLSHNILKKLYQVKKWIFG